MTHGGASLYNWLSVENMQAGTVAVGDRDPFWLNFPFQNQFRQRFHRWTRTAKEYNVILIVYITNLLFVKALLQGNIESPAVAVLCLKFL